MTASEEARTRRNAAWPHAPHVLDRAKIDRRREEALSEVVALRDRIVTARAENLADAAAQLRRLVVMADEEPRPHSLLASADACRLIASVLAVVEREADTAVNDHLTIRQAAFVMLLTLRETLPISMPLTWPRPRLPMTIRSILVPTA